MRFILFILLFAWLHSAAQDSVIKRQVYFTSGEYFISIHDRVMLDKIAATLEDKQVLKFTITGHTDNIGSDGSNDILSQKRAEIIAEYIRGKMPSVQPVINFYGEKEPVAENNDEPNRQLNRRAEIEIIVAASQQVLAKPAVKTIQLQPYIKPKQAQEFLVNVDDTVHTRAKEGTRLKIIPGSLVYKNGLVVHGDVRVIIKEYLQIDDMLWAGLHTAYGEGVLETGGMADLLFLKEADTLKINAQLAVEIGIPNSNPKQGMGVFTLASSTDTVWKNTGRPMIIKDSLWLRDGMGMNSTHYIRHYDFDIPQYNRMKTGQSFTSYIRSPAGRKLRNGFKVINPSKKATATTTKIDSVTIRIDMKAKLRKAGARLLNKESRNFDTSYFLRYQRSEYVAPVFDIGLVNADYYRKLPMTTYYVHANNGIKGGTVTTLFSRFPAILCGYEKDGVFQVGLPENEKVTLFYTGVKDGELYIGKTSLVSAPDKNLYIDVKKVSEEEFAEISSVRNDYKN
jgi:hypothetical protein